ncbi:MAG: adenine deaminase [Phycisphaerales bacterium]|nr:adenine deaminase [Phycisphaerales bacterium]
MSLKTRVDVAAGRAPADLVLRNGRIVQTTTAELISGDIAICDGVVVGIGQYDGAEVVDLGGQIVCPGFIDAHVHIESSLLNPPRYAEAVVPHGTVAVVTDPHEIANVLGVDGIRYMLDTSAGLPLDVRVMLSSCVPASHFESPAAPLDVDALRPLFDLPRVLGLAELMNYPGVVAGAADCLDKIAAAGSRVVDGHAPGLSGKALCAYVAAGIRNDHECVTADEAREKLRLGMSILIREGSQARNLAALAPLVNAANSRQFLFCTDDKDVEDLLAEGHMDYIVRRAIQGGMDPMLAVRIATLNTASHYGLRGLGVIGPGMRASLAIVDDWSTFRVSRVYQDGVLTAQDGRLVQPIPARAVLARDTMNVAALTASSFAVHASRSNAAASARVIGVIEDRIDTTAETADMRVRNGALVTDPERDILKLAVVERHHATGRVGVGFVRGFGFQRGAIASTVGHDAHNLVTCGVDDADMLMAARRLADIGGGLCVVANGAVQAEMPLPVAGLMTDVAPAEARRQLEQCHSAARAIGGRMRRPFMALSFLSLSVIGKLKLTDRGLVDVDRFDLTSTVLDAAHSA